MLKGRTLMSTIFKHSNYLKFAKKIIILPQCDMLDELRVDTSEWWWRDF